MARTSREFTAKFPGKCSCCGMKFEAGSTLLYADGSLQLSEHFWGNETGRQEREQERIGFESDPDFQQSLRDEQEYQQGLADGRRYQAEKRVYGPALAERFAAEDELVRFWKYGEDY